MPSDPSPKCTKYSQNQQCIRDSLWLSGVLNANEMYNMTELLKRMTAIANVASVLSSIPASADTGKKVKYVTNDITDTEKRYVGSNNPKGKRYCTQDTMIGPVANRYKQQKAWAEEGPGRNYNRKSPGCGSISCIYWGPGGPASYSAGLGALACGPCLIQSVNQLQCRTIIVRNNIYFIGWVANVSRSKKC